MWRRLGRFNKKASKDSEPLRPRPPPSKSTLRKLGRANAKAPTSPKPPYVVFNPHTLPPLVSSESYCKDWDVTIVTTIDPGIINCCIRQAIRCNKTSQITTHMQILSNFNHKSLNEKKDTNLLPGETQSSSVGMDTKYYVNACSILDEYIEHIQMSHYIVIESQLTINPDLVRMSQHIITYLMIKTKDKGLRPLICEIDSHLKSRMLGAPTKMKKPQLKLWCKNKAIEILESRGDLVNVKLIKEAKKADDHGDTVCYEAIWWMILDGKLNAPPLPEAEYLLSDQKEEPESITLKDIVDLQPKVKKVKIKVVNKDVTTSKTISTPPKLRLKIVNGSASKTRKETNS